MRALGICCGASTITMVEVDGNEQTPRVADVVSRAHEGNPKRVVADLLAERDLERLDRVASTGRKLRHLLNLTTVSEPLATERAVEHTRRRHPEMNAVVSAGGETFIVYKLDREQRVSKVFTGNKCASGTGEFFLQQIRRMDVDIDQAVRFARTEKPHPVSGRCSVFCKSDCTHATNKGVPKGEVVAGLCRMMAGKALELLKNIPKKNIVLVGGTTRNDVMVDYLREEIENLIVPEEATCFEALGAALWALDHETAAVDLDDLFKTTRARFEYHPPLDMFEPRVTFAEMDRGSPRLGDRCALGLDVGSTTTKAVIVRASDRKILAAEYLRTNGDPVGASKRCYASLREQLGETRVLIQGLGATGSGRKIAGLHALTEGVINEIIAHATAAIHFDRSVDTIFEIGGQDAKYTFITNGVASDYAMNEACSAGTGSFLEESAKESLGVEMEAIAEWAMKGRRPPNFNDQCAAFISSDIKNASHEGVAKEDVIAGLVYSICMNYVNRVKGARPMGRKIFMQGGVCYNRAVPIAMAALTGKDIIVPPEPGLMGAYGVALEVQDRIERGLMDPDVFSLSRLIDRAVEYKEPFICAGGKEKCDIGCRINRIAIEGKVYPFGGACDRYYGSRGEKDVDVGALDLVALREKMVFEDYAADFGDLPAAAPTVGINRSLLTNTLYPFYSHFFKGLGFRVALPERVDAEGVEARTAPFCFPLEIAHGYFHDLLRLKPDRVFLPHVEGLEVENGFHASKLCPLVQGEPFVMASTFADQIGAVPVHQPFIQFNQGVDVARGQFVGVAREMGVAAERARRAFDQAWKKQKEMEAAMRAIGRRAIAEIEADPERVGIVLFGRPYNAFAHVANKGVPRKFASRGYAVIPMDFLDLKDVAAQDHMFWSLGQIILKAAEVVEKHPRLFGTYITNFSCGPDSFIVGFFRRVFGKKPSLTLELDNHTADAGLETRIEAFLDIVARYRSIARRARPEVHAPAATSSMVDGAFSITTSSGERVALNDPRVKLIFPSMSQWLIRGFAAACRKAGVRAEALPAMNEEDLKMGKGNTLCKECLPMQLTTGALLNYLERRARDEITVYFMPTTEGPCRFGQYQVYMKNLIRARGIRDVAFMSLSTADNYAGLGAEFVLLGWYSSVVAGCFQNIHNMMLVNAVDPAAALARLNTVFGDVLDGMERGGRSGLRAALRRGAAVLAAVPMRRPVEEVPTILLVGEIYVRTEDVARRWLPEFLAEHGLATHVAPVHEWIHYVNYLFDQKLGDTRGGTVDRLKNKLRWTLMIRAEKDVNNLLVASGWHVRRAVDIKDVVKNGARYISPKLVGEAILTVGGPVAEVGKEFCGSIAIGPFGCMPNRLSESILNQNMDRDHLKDHRRDRAFRENSKRMEALPFLAVESDGSPFPQVIEARLETFVLQARRMHGIMAGRSRANA